MVFSSLIHRHNFLKFSKDFRQAGFRLDDDLTRSQQAERKSLSLDFQSLKTKGYQPYFRGSLLQYLPRAPRFIFISTTGLTRGMTDIPCLLRPSIDAACTPWGQAKAEQLLEQNTSIKEKTIIRPTMLTDGKARGWGTAAGNSSSHCNAQEGICRGYTINRRDVGEFVAKQTIQGSQWVNKTVVISN